MQIDFHHAVTYVAARLAGFPHAEADIIAYAAQYVDDATSSGTIKFDNKVIYQRISSSHKTIDFDNFNPVEDLLVWVPFHFLPGNGMAAPGADPEGTFIRKLVTLPDSPVAQDMVQAAIDDRDKPYALHRLGITMHVYADTWAHQGFAGVLHEINHVQNAEELGGSGSFADGLQKFIACVVEKTVPPLGHGKANVFPDLPFLVWKYRNGCGELVERDNTEICCAAADAMCKVMRRFRQPELSTAQAEGIGAQDMNTLRMLFETQRSQEAGKRHSAFLKAIASKKGGGFSFGPASIAYADDGERSWKAQALGTTRDLPQYTYTDAFLTSHWKLFHDALQLHRITVSHDILPRYGICGA
jgi:hypothetical protein